MGDHVPIYYGFNTQLVYARFDAVLLTDSCVQNTKSRYTFMRKAGRKEGNVLFNDALNTFYLQLYSFTGLNGAVAMSSANGLVSTVFASQYRVFKGPLTSNRVTDSERGNPLPPHGLLFPINSKGPFICTIPQTG